MAEIKTQTIEREYVIPLRRKWMKVVRYKRTARSVKAIKEFIARHMRVPDRDTKKVKLDIYLNNEIWFRGCKNPPTKIKVKAIKDGDIVRVEMVDIPEVVKFAKARHEKIHRKVEKKEPKPEEKAEKAEEKTVEEKKAEKEEGEKKEEVEKEKEKSVEQAQTKIAEQIAKAEKHTTKVKTPTAHRKALKK
ncbi:MAG: 50S ribosomal protein L31e [Nanoarchaeota archaeon]|nr:50S ribosomal protein L31e [Nanoarchaeota archaeon]